MAHCVYRFQKMAPVMYRPNDNLFNRNESIRLSTVDCIGLSTRHEGNKHPLTSLLVYRSTQSLALFPNFIYIEITKISFYSCHERTLTQTAFVLGQLRRCFFVTMSPCSLSEALPKESSASERRTCERLHWKGTIFCHICK